MNLAGVLIGGPFDGATCELEYVATAVAIYECENERCAWRDRLHWCDWAAGRKPGCERYVLEEVVDACARYVYGPMGEEPEVDVDAVREQLEILADAVAENATYAA